MPQFALEPDLLTEFIIESQELLEAYSANLLELEKHPENLELVAAVFRAAHTIKGSSAFFDLDLIKDFAHKLENLLDGMRRQGCGITGETIGFLLTGGDYLKGMLDEVGQGLFRTELTAAERDFLAELLTSPDNQRESNMNPEEALSAIFSLTAACRQGNGDAAQTLTKIERVLLTVHSRPNRSESKYPIPPSPRPASEPLLKPAYCVQGVDLTAPLSEAVDLMEAATNGGALNEAAYDQALARLAGIIQDSGLSDLAPLIKDIIEDFRAVRDSPIGYDQLILNLLKGKLDTLVESVKTKTVKDEAVLRPVPEPSAATAGDQELPATTPGHIRRDDRTQPKTMRISEEKVDGFMDCVGELLVTAETFRHLQKAIEGERVNPEVNRAFKEANMCFGKLSGQLQECLMAIRRVPIKGLTQRVQLMARDLAQRLNKMVGVEISGQDVQIDKSIAERLEGPLMHVVRNALDHGLESPEDRDRSAKPLAGLLRVSASTDNEFFYLDIQDDGRGIDPRAIKASALKKGLITPERARTISDQEAMNLIFEPGFSTAAQVSEVSGRGVGMDVVRTNIQELNGSITLDSSPGKGTTISFKIPLKVTLQVIEAIIVRVGNQPFAVPLKNINGCLRPRPEDLVGAPGRGELVNLQGRLTPLIRLYDLFHLTPERNDPTQASLVMLEAPQGPFALMVDDISDMQKVVVKELGPVFGTPCFLAGCVTLGDGRLALVLEPEGLIRLA